MKRLTPETEVNTEEAIPEPAPWWHYFVIFLIPAVLWSINPNWLFENLGHMDAWYYFGLFKTFPRFHNLLANYPGERMTWVFPGWVLVRWLGQVAGVIALHCGVFLISLYLFHYILRRLCDNLTAFAGAVLLGCHSCFIGSNGWDYVESMSIALLLTNIAILVKASFSARPQRYLFVSGMAWAALLYSYLAWTFLIPAYFCLGYGLIFPQRPAKGRIALSLLTVFCGGAATSLILAAIYYSLGGQRIFFYENVKMAIGLSQMTKNPYVTDSHWLGNASWLLFPALALGIAVVMAIRSLAGKIRLSRRVNALLGFYLLCWAAMIGLTIHQLRLLEFSYFASILMPGTFVVLGMWLFKPPANVPRFLFLATLAAGGMISVLPMGFHILYALGHVVGLYGPLALVAIAAVWRWIDRSSPVFWSLSILSVCGAVTGLLPGFPAAAWVMDYDGPQTSERVSRAMDAIIARLPADQYPRFWIDNSGARLTPEYRGIMCSFMVYRQSMWGFPKVDRTYSPGVHVFTITEQKEVTAGSLYRLARAGMAASVAGQDLISYHGISYWISDLLILPPSMENMRIGYEPVSLGREDSIAFEVGQGAPISRRMIFAKPGVYQFELHYQLAGGGLTFGSLSDSGGWMERSSPPLEEAREQVSWFRLGVKAGAPVDLAAQADAAPNARPLRFVTPPKLEVFRDTGGAAPETFDFPMDRSASDGNPILNGRF
jgi:hypothetical protein